LIAGKSSQASDWTGNRLLPRASFETTITARRLISFTCSTPQSLPNYCGVNGDHRPLSTRLQCHYQTGAISLFNDPDLQLIGIGTRIFLGGGIGYVAWEGTQHFPLQSACLIVHRLGPAHLSFNWRCQMNAHWVRGCYFKVTVLLNGLGVPLPVLNEEW